MERESFMTLILVHGTVEQYLKALRCGESVMSSRTCKFSHSRLFTFSLLPYMQPSACITCLLVDYPQMKLVSESLLCSVSSLFRIILRLTSPPRKIPWCSRPGLQHYIHRPLLDHCSVSCEGSLGQAGAITTIIFCAKKTSISQLSWVQCVLPIFYP